MRLKSSIFLWVSLATILPLTALILGITAYSEQVYLKNIDNDIYINMENISKELNFRLTYEREVILSLANSPAMEQFAPVLQTAAEGDLHINYFEEVDKLNNFLAGFQHSVPGLDTVRVLDIDGHALIKVRFGKLIPAHFEGIADLPLTEEELVDTGFLSWMWQLKANELVYGNLPLSKRDYTSGKELSIMNSIVPVSFDNKTIIGFLTARALGDQFDHILESLHRTNNIKLTVAEYNPDTAQRHGIILYSDELQIKFSQPLDPDTKLNKILGEQTWNNLQSKRFGSFVNHVQNKRYYFQEFYPYNNQLVSWIMVLQLDNSDIAAPFQRIRFGLLAVAVLALVISLLLANIGARNIAEPITLFADLLKRYADGEPDFSRQPTKGADELKQLDQSFHYLVDTLEQTEMERDSAEKMMLQNAKLASIGQMAAGIGHELNNPLNNILSYATLIKRDIPKENTELADDIQGLRNEALRAETIVKGILNFARQVPPEYVDFDLHVWLKDTLLLAHAQAQKFNIELKLDEHPDLPICGDRNQLQQVLVNLLMNAIHASKQNDIIIVSAHTEKQQIFITVSDQGTGIESSNKDKIFDPFFTTKNVGEGSGLGLSISIGIMQFHNGSLKLENNDRGGVNATMQIPLNSKSN
ncbi:MAG: sensor histidine kinase [endosymbiont of Galathealinum brachiosum]|uniref:histidine kinase n=1 Tax=endosymbiont of Galathealinum brachiosum TaxID=2200906 RepID=A0A370DCI6_9GAMM|nr:MAG: sensor histidine kinase [endosymbiont of Galathealinum brachiosum]